MDEENFSRRKFLAKVSAGTIAVGVSTAIPTFGTIVSKSSSKKLAILGGDPVRQNRSWPKWPYVDDNVVNKVVETTKSGIWSRIQSRNGTVPTFEKKFADMMGVKYAVGTGSGTQSLSTGVEAMGIGPGDEVITSPYSDFGTIASILMSRALPVMADLDKDSFQIDPDDVERRVNKNTKAIMPVHMMGQPCNMERIMEIAEKHNLMVIEDACQAPLSVYQGKKVGTIGDLGCISFQASKAIACGEGGIIIGNDEKLMDECYAVHNRGANKMGQNATIGTKYRMNEFEGAVLLGQLPGVQERFERRNENANYLNERLKGFPGVVPQKQYEGTESGAYYKYAMRYNPEHFDNADRAKFLKALSAEGINLSGYIREGFHGQPWIDHILGLDEYKRAYSSERLKQYKEEMDYPNCDNVCEHMLAMNGPGPLLGTKEDMDHIVDAIFKVYENRNKLSSIK